MKYRGIGLTDIGRHRERNEDHLLVDNEFGLYMVADGLGGHAAGDVASQLAIDAAAQYIDDRRAFIEEIRRGNGDEGALASVAVAAVAAASRSVYDATQLFSDLAGMGCTFTMLLMGRQVAAMAHVGDSRLYRLRDGAVAQLSTDHTVAQKLVSIGAVTGGAETLKQNQRRYGHLLTRSIGRRDLVEIDELLFEVRSGDRFVLCSDGLSDYLSEPAELGLLVTKNRFEVCAQCLIDFANCAGGRDNITAVVVCVDECRGSGECSVVESTGAPIGTNQPASTYSLVNGEPADRMADHPG